MLECTRPSLACRPRQRRMGRPAAAQMMAAAATAGTAGSGRTPSPGPRGVSRRATISRRADRRCKIEIQRPGTPRHASVSRAGHKNAAWCSASSSGSKAKQRPKHPDAVGNNASATGSPLPACCTAQATPALSCFAPQARPPAGWHCNAGATGEAQERRRDVVPAFQQGHRAQVGRCATA